MKVLLLADVPDGWIVSRIAERMVREMPDIEWEGGHYCCLSTEQIRGAGAGVDLIHALNWNFAVHIPGLLDLGKPILMSVRSHRYSADVPRLAAHVKVHVISKALQAQFPGSVYIPDGVMIEPQPLKVGFAGKPGPYKGSDLIERACREIGAEYHAATNLKPEQMPAFYRHIDVLVCMSENEGYGASVMEALALNKPVVSTCCGAAWEAQLPGVTWIKERTVGALAAALMSYWPARYLERYTWTRVCGEFRQLYADVLSHRAD